MSEKEISAKNPYDYKSVDVLDIKMTYIDTEKGGDTFVFVHGNPTSSYLWRNIMPHVEPLGRCVAPDLPGFGKSDAMPSGTWRYPEFSKYFEEFMNKVVPDGDVILVLHDWGAAVGFNWANHNRERVKGICYGEAMVQPRKITDLPEGYRERFMYMRSKEGMEEAIAENFFVTKVFPNGIIRRLSEEEMEEYAKRFTTPEAIAPTIIFPNEIPFDGEPADNHETVKMYADWLAETDVPKLFINTTQGHALVGRNRDFCRTWKNQKEVTVEGKHFYQEDAPHEIGQALVEWYETIEKELPGG